MLGFSPWGPGLGSGLEGPLRVGLPRVGLGPAPRAGPEGPWGWMLLFGVWIEVVGSPFFIRVRVRIGLGVGQEWVRIGLGLG